MKIKQRMLYSKEKLEKLRHRWATPKGKLLIKTIKKSHCYLSPVLFREKVKSFPGINDEEVQEGVDLRGAPLAGFDFRVKVKEYNGCNSSSWSPTITIPIVTFDSLSIWHNQINQ